jgi:hypothetical protein
MGASLANSHFGNWSERLGNFAKLFNLDIKKETEKRFSIESAILHSFTAVFPVTQTETITSDTSLKMRFSDSYHQNAADLLARHGWVKDDFVFWNKITVSRYNEYAEKFKSRIQGAPQGGQMIGFAFLCHVDPDATTEQFLSAAIPIEVWVLSTVGEFSKRLAKFRIKN